MNSKQRSKVILVTGASSGIGEAAARRLVGQGHKVVLGARRTDRLQVLTDELRNVGGQVAFRALDVRRLEDVQAFAAFAETTFGPIEVIVNNAGVMPLSPLKALKVDEWDRMIDVNVRGVLHGIAAVLPAMEARRARDTSSTSRRSAGTRCRPRPPCTARPSLRCARSPTDCARRPTRSA